MGTEKRTVTMPIDEYERLKNEIERYKTYKRIMDDAFILNDWSVSIYSMTKIMEGLKIHFPDNYEKAMQIYMAEAALHGNVVEYYAPKQEELGYIGDQNEKRKKSPNRSIWSKVKEILFS